MKLGATIQARMGSSRLPGKVLMTIVGKPMLQLQVERIQQSNLIDEVIIATSMEARDDAIEALARRIGVPCFRGSEDDVLSRVVGALKRFDVDIHAEFMGDSPIPDPLLIDAVVGYYLKHRVDYDYVTNALTMTYPPGTDVYVYPSRVLYEIERKLTDPAQREYVGWNIRQSRGRYRICNLEAPPWFHYPDLHLEVDTREDFEVITAIFEHFYPDNRGFGLGQVIDFMKANPELAEHNRHVERRWKALLERVE